MDNAQMLQDVHQSFSNLGEKYPRIKSNLEKCFKDIKEKCGVEKSSPNEEKKEHIKNLLMKFMDTSHLWMTYEGLMEEIPKTQEQLVQVLKKLSKAILSHKKKTSWFASRQGQLLKDGKIYLSKKMFKDTQKATGFTTRYCNFLISLYKLFEEYPRLGYCGVSIRTFMSNMKIIREICEEDETFWENIS